MDKDYEWMKSKKSIVILVRACVPMCTYTGTTGGQKSSLAVASQDNCIPSFFFFKVCILFIYFLTFLLKIFHTIYFNHIFLLPDPPQFFLHPAL